MAIDINDFRGLANLAKRNQVDVSDFDKNGDTLLARAIQAVSSESAEFLMKQGCPVDTQNKYHETPLHWACLNRLDSIVQTLVRLTSDINYPSYNGYTPLHCAVRGGCISCVQILLENQAKVDYYSDHQLTPLMMAVSDGNIEMTKLLLQYGASAKAVDKYNQTILHFACRAGDAHLIQIILQTDVSLTAVNDNGESAIHYSIKGGNLSSVKLILEALNRSEINSVDKQGNTALHLAASLPTSAFISQLLSSSSINPTIKNNHGLNALDFSCKSGAADSVKILASKINERHSNSLCIALKFDCIECAKILIQSKNNLLFCEGKSIFKERTPLHFAALTNNSNILCDIIKVTTNDINSKDSEGNTPLHLAAKSNSVNVIKYLLTVASDINIVNNQGMNVLHIAAYNNSIHALTILLENAKCSLFVNVKDNNGNTPIQLTKSLDIVRLIIEKSKPNLFSVNNKGENVMDIAIKNISLEIVRYLSKFSVFPQTKRNSSHILPYITDVSTWQLAMRNSNFRATVDYNQPDENGVTPLLQAIRLGNNSGVSYLIHKCKIEKSHQDNFGWTALHYGAYYSNLEVIILLMKNGYNPIVRDNDGRTPLLLSLENPKIVEYLLYVKGKEQCRIFDNHGYLPIHIVCKMGNSNLLEKLLSIESFSNPEETELFFYRSNRSPLHVACFYGYLNCVTILLDKVPSIDVNLEDPISKDTPLLLAIRGQHHDIVKYLLNKSNINVNNTSVRYLHEAATIGNSNILKSLIEHNANVSLIDKDKEYAIHKAFMNGNIDCVDILLQAGSPTDQTEVAMSPILHAVKLGNIRLAMQLFTKLIEPFAEKDEDSKGLLHYAAISGSVHCFSVLADKLENPIQINSVDRFGKTPLHYAVEYGHYNIVAYLVGIGADLSIACKEFGNTPLHYAVKYRRIYQFLLSKGASQSVQNNSRLSPIQLLQGHSRGLAPRRSARQRISASSVQDKRISKSGWVSVKLDSAEKIKEPTPTISNSRSPEFIKVEVGNKKKIKLKETLKNSNSIFKLIDNGDEESISKLLNKNQKALLDVRDEHGNLPLIHAIIARQFTIVGLLLVAQANPNLANGDGRNALVTAIQEGSKESISLLLMHGADTNLLDKNEERTPLAIVAEQGDHKLIRQLISYHASVDSQLGVVGRSPLYIAASKGHDQAVKILIKHGASVNTLAKSTFQAPLHAAVSSGNIECVKTLLESKADVGITTPQNRTPLHLAIGHTKFEEISKILIANNANINCGDEEENTPLHLACEYNYFDTARVLLSHNPPASVCIKNDKGLQPIHYAAKIGNEEILTLLVKSNANIHAIDNEGRNIFHHACLEGNIETCSWIFGKDNTFLNSIDNNLKTPLHYAVMSGSTHLVLVLLNWRVNITLKDIHGHSALYYALENNRFDLAECILEIIGKIRRPSHKRETISFSKQIIDHQGRTPLHKIISLKIFDSIPILVDKGANVNAVDSLGETPLLLSCKFGYIDAVQLLLNCNADPLITSGGGKNAIELSIHKEESDIVKLLLENTNIINSYNAKDDSCIYHWISRSIKHAELYFTLLSKIDTSLLPSVNSVDNQHRTPLCIAAKKSNIIALKELILLNADINIIDSNEMSPVLYSAYGGCLDGIKLLLNEKANISSRTTTGLSPLLAAASGGHSNLVTYLVEECNCDINDVDYNGNSALHFAAISNHTKVCEILLSNNLNINCKNTKGKTPLLLAAENISLDTMKLLTLHNADPNITDNNGITAIHACAQYCPATELLTFKEAGIDLSITSKNGRTPLHFASHYSNLEAVKLLLEHTDTITFQDNLGMTPLHLASRYDIISILFEKYPNSCFIKDTNGRLPIHTISLSYNGDNIEILKNIISTVPNCIYEITNSGKTPLHYAIIGENTSTISFLIDNGANVNTLEYEYGFSPLHFAIRNLNRECCELLLDNGAESDIQGLWNSRTPLHEAVMKNNVSLVRILLDYGADPNRKDSQGNTPLHLACWNLSESCIELLIQYKTNLIALNIKKQTPLEICLSKNDSKGVNILYLFLKYGFPVNYFTENGYTFLHICCSLGFVSWVKVLIGLGADINLCDKKEGMTSAMFASLSGHLSILEILHHNHANFNKLSNSGNSCFHYASKSNHFDVVAYLYEIDDNYACMKNKDDKLPLQLAAESGNTKITSLLLKNIGSKNEEVDCFGFYPIHWAAFVNSLADFKELLSRGCSPLVSTKDSNWNVLQCLLLGKQYINNNEARERRVKFLGYILQETGVHSYIDKCVTTNDNDSLFHLASLLDQPEIFSILNIHGTFDINSTNSHGCSPLHYAVLSTSPLCVEYLINQNADVNITDKNGTSCLMKALYCLHFNPDAKNENSKEMSIIKLLIDNHANLDIVNSSNESALHYACLYGCNQMVMKILESSNDIKNICNIKDSSGATPLHWASFGGQREIMKILLKNGCNIDEMDKLDLTSLHYAIFNHKLSSFNYLIKNNARLPENIKISPQNSTFYRKVNQILKQKKIRIN